MRISKQTIFNHINKEEEGGHTVSVPLTTRNCMLCKYYHGYADSYSMEPCCGLSRKYGTPYSQKQEEARTCQYYTLNQPLVTRVTEAIKDMKITEVKK